MRMENITSLPHYLDCAAVVMLKAELGDKMFLGHKTIVDLAVRFYNVWILNCEENGNAKTMISFDVQGIPPHETELQYNFDCFRYNCFGLIHKRHKVLKIKRN